MISPVPFRTAISGTLTIARIWINWFNEVRDAVNTISGGTP